MRATYPKTPGLVVVGLVELNIYMFWIFDITQQGNIVLEVCPSISLTKNKF